MKAVSNGTVRVKILDREYRKLDAWARLATGEISALGMVELESDGPLITSLFMPRQVCTGASSDMNQEDVGAYLCELMARGEEGKLRAWVHSHGDLGVFWSGTDQNTIKDLGSDPYLVSVVVNRKGEYKARIDINSPFKVTMEDLSLVVVYRADKDLEDECRAELAAKVTSPAPSSTLGRFSDRFAGFRDPRMSFGQGWPRDKDDDRPFAGSAASSDAGAAAARSEATPDVHDEGEESSLDSYTALEQRYGYLYDLEDLVEFAHRAGGDLTLYTATGFKGEAVTFRTESELDKAHEIGMMDSLAYEVYYRALNEFRDLTLRGLEEAIDAAWTRYDIDDPNSGRRLEDEDEDEDEDPTPPSAEDLQEAYTG